MVLKNVLAAVAVAVTLSVAAQDFTDRDTLRSEDLTRFRIINAAVAQSHSGVSYASALYEALPGVIFRTNIGVNVVGISRDSAESHRKFADKYSLPFIILSDPDLEAIKAYGVWQEKKNYGKTMMGVVRTTFILDENGTVTHVMPKVKPDTNAAEILEMLK